MYKRSKKVLSSFAQFFCKNFLNFEEKTEIIVSKWRQKTPLIDFSLTFHDLK